MRISEVAGNEGAIQHDGQPGVFGKARGVAQVAPCSEDAAEKGIQKR